MAHSATTRWMWWTTGAATNGGAFDAYMGADQVTASGADAANSLTCDLSGTTITSGADCTHFSAGMVGSILVVTGFAAGGGGWVSGWYRIATYVSEHVVTVDLSPCPLTAGTGGIGFVSAGIDYSFQAAAQLAFTSPDHNLLAAGAGADVSAEHVDETFTAAHVGNTLYIASGPNFTVGWYQVLSVAAGVATLDRACASGAETDGTGSLGGALTILNGTTLTAHQIDANNHAPGQSIAIKSGTYTFTTANLGVGVSGTSALPIEVCGFYQYPGDISQPRAADWVNTPLLDTSTYTMYWAVYWNLCALRFSTATTTGVGHSANAYSFVRRCGFLNVRNPNGVALSGSAGSRYENCWFVAPTGWAVAPASSCYFYRCFIFGAAHATSGAFAMTTVASLRLLECIVAGGNIGWTCTTGGQHALDNCVVYNLGTGLLPSGASTGWIIRSSIFAYNGTGANWSGGAYLTNSEDYGDWYGNTVDATNLAKGPNDTAYDPAFVGHLAWGSIASTAGTKVLTGLSDCNARFQAWDAAPGAGYLKRRVIRIVSGTNFTAGTYLIDSVLSDTSIQLEADPTSVGDGSFGVAYDCMDFTLGAASSCRGAGVGIALGVG
jgi:hypothetical protein